MWHLPGPVIKPLFPALASRFLSTPPIVVQLCPTHCSLMDCRIPCPSLSPRVCWNSCPLSQWFYHLILCLPLVLWTSVFPSIVVFSNGLALLIKWPWYWTFSFSISPSSEYSELISLRIGCFHLRAVQGTLKIFLQHNLKASVLWCSASLWSNSHICTRLLEKL